MINISSPKAIIGLGNPGIKFEKTRHNIGFMIVDQLAKKFGGQWKSKDNLEFANISINNNSVLLVKPQTFMNNSGAIIPFLNKQGIKNIDVLIIHDELELTFGKIATRIGGSAKGHNGLKSFISIWGDNFARLRFGIGRPENKEDVPNYVLANFRESNDQLAEQIHQSIELIESMY